MDWDIKINKCDECGRARTVLIRRGDRRLCIVCDREVGRE